MVKARAHEHAVVIGGSMAGLCAARVLADRFERVTVVERDAIPSTPGNRRGVPQGRHVHALLMAGGERLEGWFPGLDAELRASGAPVIDAGRDLHWYHLGGERVRYPFGTERVVCSRPLLEHHVRSRVLALPNVELCHAGATGLRTDTAGDVTGVHLETGKTLASDLVVDATGRASRSASWLAELGYEPPATSKVHIDMGYTSRRYRQAPDRPADFTIAIVLGEPPSGRMGVAFAQENGEWLVTLCGFHGDHAPTDDAGFLAFARTLPSPVVADIIEHCAPIGGYMTHRMPDSQRRHVEDMRGAPGGLVFLGDSVASFNPIYGQGMSSATLQAEALATALDRSSRLDARCVRRCHRLIAKAVDTPWRLSVGGDFQLPQTTGAKPRGTDTIGKYMRNVIRAAQSDARVARRLTEVQQLLRPPAVLLTPTLAWRVRRAVRNNPPANPRPVPALASATN